MPIANQVTSLMMRIFARMALLELLVFETFARRAKVEPHREVRPKLITQVIDFV